MRHHQELPIPHCRLCGTQLFASGFQATKCPKHAGISCVFSPLPRLAPAVDGRCAPSPMSRRVSQENRGRIHRLLRRRVANGHYWEMHKHARPGKVTAALVQ
eukprot:gnl/TRDRNA2_/TRDRNA2_123887_c3_seq1.p1 gnl/TRDRNA2_/TRDRNA2_123887_c3~~gnl/TRDRNA2_/TRDRNA2_123887_c3_seq1.p1  ORF type:complete len:102 (-),score=2.05 gnl/TRDRNA2_/TRDRNA2_123887_c3_seq1:17-322(-)